MKIIFILLIIFGFALNSYSQFPNFKIHPSNNAQIEPSIVHHPLNPLLLFCSAYTISPGGSGFRSESVYVSTDGGITWSGTDTCSGAPVSTGHGGDPGPVIDKNGVFLMTHQGGLVTGMFANTSTNQGASWTINYTIASNDQDKGSPFTDDVAASSYYGRTFLVWTRYTNPFPIVISYTSNSGTSWSSLAQINSGISGRQSVGPVGVTGPDGTEYVSWASADNSAGLVERGIGFASSTNGGVNWNVQENIFSITGIKTSSLQPWGIRVNSYPEMDIDKTNGSRRGWIYIVVSEKNQLPSGNDADVILFRSSDGGATWSSGKRVNQDPINNGKVQYFPVVSVDALGGVSVVYYDNRLSTGAADSTMNVFLSYSKDGGSTFTDYKISDHTFKPSSVSGTGSGNQGDNIGITNAGGYVIPVWMDNSTGNYQVWGSRISILTLGVNTISSEIPNEYSLYQNYPNPFNPTTKIRFSIQTNNSQTSLIVYDMNGKEVKRLVEKTMNAGTYETEFTTEGVASGIYTYKLISNGFESTKKMVLIK
ncbi:hypothetical protein BH10BAC5_BH10BAC5_05590 [soil metagenome]